MSHRLHEDRSTVSRRALTPSSSDEALPNFGLARLLNAPALRQVRIYSPIPSGAPAPRWILQTPRTPAVSDLSPGDLVILEGNCLPQSDTQAANLAINLRESGCAACICVRSEPPKAFQNACEKERVALLGLSASPPPSRVARDLALVLLSDEDRVTALKAGNSGPPELEDLEKEFERLSGQTLETDNDSSSGVETARNALRAARDAWTQEIRLLAEARSALSRLSDRKDPSDEEIVVRALAVVTQDRKENEEGRNLRKTIEYALPSSAHLEILPFDEPGTNLFTLTTRREDDKASRDSLRSLAEEERLSMGISTPARSRESLGDAAEKAVQALKLGQALIGRGHLSSYENAALYLAYIDDGRDEPLLAFSRRTVERIRGHDERTGEGLLATLEAYFRNDRNARKTAAELGIQRHTLANRLARIENLTDYPLRGEGRIGYELALVLQYWTKGRISR